MFWQILQNISNEIFGRYCKVNNIDKKENKNGLMLIAILSDGHSERLEISTYG